MTGTARDPVPRSGRSHLYVLPENRRRVEEFMSQLQSRHGITLRGTRSEGSAKVQVLRPRGATATSGTGTHFAEWNTHPLRRFLGFQVAFGKGAFLSPEVAVVLRGRSTCTLPLPSLLVPRRVLPCRLWS